MIVVGYHWTLSLRRYSWNLNPMNVPPVSCVKATACGHAYMQCHALLKRLFMYCAVDVWVCIISKISPVLLLTFMSIHDCRKWYSMIFALYFCVKRAHVINIYLAYFCLWGDIAGISLHFCCQLFCSIRMFCIFAFICPFPPDSWPCVSRLTFHHQIFK